MCSKQLQLCDRMIDHGSTLQIITNKFQYNSTDVITLCCDGNNKTCYRYINITMYDGYNE